VAASRRQAGVTLLEMMIVVALAAILAGIAFPAVSSGLDTLRLNSAAESIASYLNTAMNRVERDQQVMEIGISRKDNALTLRSTVAGYRKRLEIPDGIAIADVLPEDSGDPGAVRYFLLYPGGSIPRIVVKIVNQRGRGLLVSVDPITGVAEVARDEQK
jgi:prepilin-type N-terminal cleavage/methylation domain-containing protein